MIDRVSIEPSRRCSKGCGFCYNGSSPRGGDGFSAREVIELGRDLAAHGVRAISFGGGEPLEWPGIWDALEGLSGVMFRSLTTHGLGLDVARVARARPDKVHVSIHAASETARVIEQVKELERAGVRSGVNLLVRASRLEEARDSARALRAAGIGNERVVYLPMRGADTPRAAEVASVAEGPFQSMTCLPACGKSPRFASIGADRSAAWCSYTIARRPLASLTFEGLTSALRDLDLVSCDKNLVKARRA